MFYSFSNHLQYNTACFIDMLITWVLGGSASPELHSCYAINAFPCLFQRASACHWGFFGFAPWQGHAEISLLYPSSPRWKDHCLAHPLDSTPFYFFRCLCFTGASNQCLAWRSAESSPLSCVTILSFCSIVPIPVAAPVAPDPLFSSLIFLSSVCTASQANHFTWDSSPDVAFSFHHLQIAS